MENFKNLIIFDLAACVPLILFFLFPPKKINSIFGYKTSRSLKNQKNWDYAQKFSSQLFLLIPAILFLTQLSLFFDKSKDLINIILYISIFEYTLFSIIVILMTEHNLKKLDSENHLR